MVRINQNEILRVNPEVKRYVKAQAALKGMSMKDFVNMKLCTPKEERKQRGFNIGF